MVKINKINAKSEDRIYISVLNKIEYTCKSILKKDAIRLEIRHNPATNSTIPDQIT
jgi:hypothetical protein